MRDKLQKKDDLATLNLSIALKLNQLPNASLFKEWKIAVLFKSSTCAFIVLLSLSVQPSLLYAQPIPELLRHWIKHAPVCVGPKGLFPNKSHHRSFTQCTGKEDSIHDDAVLFNGLLCAVGYQVSCEVVLDAQDSYGQWFRSPWHRTGNPADFSFDQAKGVYLTLAKLAQTGYLARGGKAATNWYNWMNDNKTPCQIWGLKGCLIGHDFRMCGDGGLDTCLLTKVLSPSWGLKARVWDALELEKKNLMKQNIGEDDNKIAPFALANRGKGFEAHIYGAEVYIRQVLKRPSGNAAQAARYLWEAHKDNAFFHYLVHGANSRGMELVLAKCPGINTRLTEKTVWLWEQAPNAADWRGGTTKSMLWDCIFAVGLHGYLDQKSVNRKLSGQPILNDFNAATYGEVVVLAN